jgi:putative DNA methylase
MAWDFTEVNPFSDSTGNITSCLDWARKVLEFSTPKTSGKVEQKTAQEGLLNSQSKVVSTDPPYYDNISYADLSDFFYIWLRRSLKSIYPEIFSTVMVPKVPELVATPYRENRGKEGAERFFLEGMTDAIRNIQQQQPDEYPVTIYYAFKQSETKDEGIASTGWATFLEAVINAGFSINGTWPMRTELSNRMIASGTNALASSVVLVCRKQPEDAKTVTRKDFIQDLRRELPDAIKNLQHSNLAPVDMAQASIGPGMAIFSRYAKVMEADGTAMSVKTALQLINEELDRYLAEQEGEYDVDTRFAITWFEQFGMKEGEYGTAETLANARGVSVQGVVQSGILTAKAGKAKLISRDDMPTDWDPKKDDRATVWEATQHLIRVAFANEGYNETAAAELLNKLGPLGESARDLAYRLYSICERKKWADEALAYNNLVVAWPEILERASQLKQLQPVEPVQQTLMEV